MTSRYWRPAAGLPKHHRRLRFTDRQNLSLLAACGTLGKEPATKRIEEAAGVNTGRKFEADVIAANRRRLSADSRAAAGRHIVMVGGGIVNLVTAWWLVANGYLIDVYDAGPGPTPSLAWQAHGCTLAGDNARMFSLTEADVYHRDVNALAGTRSCLLDTPVSMGGWQVFPKGTQTGAETQWAREFASVPGALSARYEDDMIGFNREAMHGWAALKLREPDLFADSGLNEGILRLYTSAAKLRQAIDRQARVGALRRVLSPAEIASSHPALTAACAAQELAGGIEVVGFTVGIHDFVRNLGARLTESGVRFHWNHPIERIVWTSPSSDVVAEVTDFAGRPVQADHFVLSLGAYAGDLLRGTLSTDRIQGVLGIWITIPNLYPPLTNSVKLQRHGHVTPDTNITIVNDSVRGPLLILGAGYGWTGRRPQNADPAELEALYRGVEDTANRFFPDAYRVAGQDRSLFASRRFCVRPWTTTNLGLFEVKRTAAGGVFIVTGGHNTGGFAQSPAIAEAVRAALRGTAHPMHVLCHPLRLQRDLGQVAAGGT